MIIKQNAKIIKIIAKIITLFSKFLKSQKNFTLPQSIIYPIELDVLL